MSNKNTYTYGDARIRLWRKAEVVAWRRLGVRRRRLTKTVRLRSAMNWGCGCDSGGERLLWWFVVVVNILPDLFPFILFLPFFCYTSYCVYVCKIQWHWCDTGDEENWCWMVKDVSFLLFFSFDESFEKLTS